MGSGAQPFRLKQINPSGGSEGQVPRLRSNVWTPEDLPDLPNDALVFGPADWLDSDETAPAILARGAASGQYQGALNFVNGSDLEIETRPRLCRPTKGTAAGTLKLAIVMSASATDTLGIAVEANINGAGFSAITGSPFTVAPAAGTTLQEISVGSVTVTAGDIIALRIKRTGSTDANSNNMAQVFAWIDYSQDGAAADLGEEVVYTGGPTNAGGGQTQITSLVLAASDVGGGTYSLSSDRVVIPRSGWYQISVSVEWETDTGNTNLRRYWVIKNGGGTPVTLHLNGQASGDNSAMGTSGSIVAELAASDTIEVTCGVNGTPVVACTLTMLHIRELPKLI